MNPQVPHRDVFAAKVPAGSYKILAQRFDGTLIPAYYTSGEGNAAGFATAETVQITDAGVSWNRHTLGISPNRHG